MGAVTPILSLAWTLPFGVLIRVSHAKFLIIQECRTPNYTKFLSYIMLCFIVQGKLPTITRMMQTWHKWKEIIILWIKVKILQHWSRGWDPQCTDITSCAIQQQPLWWYKTIIVHVTLMIMHQDFTRLNGWAKSLCHNQWVKCHGLKSKRSILAFTP